MKEIKAYVRPNFLDGTIEALEEAGARDMTVIRVDAIGALADYEQDRWHVLRKYSSKYSALAKIELVCRDDEAAQFVEVIREHCHTGERGDGRIFVSDIASVVNIRTGKTGEKAL